MSEIRRVNTGDAPRNVYHAGDAPRTVNTGRTVKTGSALNQDEYLSKEALADLILERHLVYQLIIPVSQQIGEGSAVRFRTGCDNRVG